MTGITPQGVLLCLGIASLVASSALAGLALRTYVREDIRAVRDDLSGRRRAAALADGRAGRPHGTARPSGRSARTSLPEPGGPAPPVPFRVTGRVVLLASDVVIDGTGVLRRPYAPLGTSPSRPAPFAATLEAWEEAGAPRGLETP